MYAVSEWIRVPAAITLRLGLRRVALMLYRFGAARYPEDRYLSFEYARVCVDAGCLEEAERIFTRLVDDDYNLPAAQFLLATIKQQRGHHEAAVALFEAVIEQEPQHATVQYNLGVSFVALKRWEDAIAAFTQAVKLEPHAVDASSNLGIALVESGRPQSATVWFQKAVRLGGSCDDYVNLGVNLHEIGNWEEAEVAYRRALGVDAKSAGVKIRLATLLANMSRFHEALDLLESSRLRGSDAWVEQLRSYVLLKLGRLEDARSAAILATHLSPDLADAHASLGLIYLAERNGAAALAEWDTAVQLEPERLELHAGKAAALSLNQRHAEALTIFESVLAEHPDLLSKAPELKAAYDESARHRA